MNIKKDQNTETFLSLRQIGSLGWNTFDDVQDIQDLELADVLNMELDKGYPTPRGGSALAFEKPVGETNDILNLFDVRDSKGTNYVIAVYAPNFYLRDEVNNQWVKINSTYTPSSTYKTLLYGYRNWNAGIGSDVLYCGNGTEDCIKWPIAVGYLAGNQLAADGTLTLVDGASFPTGGGTIVIQVVGGSPIYKTYTSRTGNVLTLSGTLGTNTASGAIVTSQIADATTVTKGKIFSSFLGRLIVANSAGGESTLASSQVGNAENFTIGTDAGDPFLEVITDGNSGITGLDVFGQFLVVEKANSLFQISIDTAVDSSGASYQVVNTKPLVDGISSGPTNPQAKIKQNNLLYYLTDTEGIWSVNPLITGGQTSVQPQLLSLKIQPFVLGLDFSNARTTSFNQKVLWSCTSAATADTVLVYNLLRQTWTRYNNWPVKDWLRHNKKLYYASRTDNNIYQCFTSSKLDGSTPFEAYANTKMFDFGKGAIPKTTGRIYVQGYISPQQNLYFDVLYNIGGSLQTVNYMINGSDGIVTTNIPTALAMFMLGSPVLGSVEVTQQNGIGIFKGYLAVPSRYGFFALGLKVHGTVNGTDFALTGIGFSPWEEIKSPANLEIGAIGDVTTSNPVLAIGGSTFSAPTNISFYVDTVSGTIDGANTTFTVPNTITSALMLSLAGMPYQAGVDFTVSGKTIEMTVAPDISLSGSPFFLVHD